MHKYSFESKFQINFLPRKKAVELQGVHSDIFTSSKNPLADGKPADSRLGAFGFLILGTSTCCKVRLKPTDLTPAYLPKEVKKFI
jgi:hypothetical protein